MAPPKSAVAAPGQASLPLKTNASNGVLTSTNTPAGSINRKKQKRRQKQAAKQTVNQDPQSVDYGPDDDNYANGDLSTTAQPPLPANPRYSDPYVPGSMPAENQYEYDDGEYAYSDEEGQYAYDPATPATATAGDYGIDESRTRRKSKKKKKRQSQNDPAAYDHPPSAPGAYPRPPFTHPPPPPPPRKGPSDDVLRTVERRINRDPIWDTSTQEERSRIKEFWLSLAEDDRKSLVKIEKEAVLRKMKEQQKHSCSCTVCGRKRTAIEEELEVLYDAYYEELEQFANHNQRMSENGTPMLPPASRFAHSMSRGPPDRMSSAKDFPRPMRSRIHELADDDDEGKGEEVEEDEEDALDEDEDEELDDEEYSDAEYDDEYTSNGTDEYHPPEQSPAANDFFSFGKSLTVKGGILTVADDLLKNDGQKFIDMMEQLAERRMQREEDAALAPYRMAHQAPMGGQHPPNPHSHPPPEEEEYSDEEDEEFDSEGDDLDEEEDDMNTMSEEQRMEEGRRMFQIFAARMFEQRVLTAYREKVARDRQNKLIEELQSEALKDTERDAKKARDAEKKRVKKQQQKAAKAEEKARKDAEKAAEEQALKRAEEKRQDELRRKREEQRRKKDAERRAAEEEKQRKEAEKQKRLQQERDRQQEAQRKVAEAKAEERRRKDEARRKEKEEREAKEKEARERKAHADRWKKAKEEATEVQREAPSTSDGSKRASIPAIVALPPGLKPQRSNASYPSPTPKVATPVLPKAATPVKPRETSHSTSQRSTPQTPEVAPQPRQAASPKALAEPTQSHGPHAPIPRAPSQAPFHGLGPQPPGMHPLGPPPGMPHPVGAGFPIMPPGPFSGYPGSAGGMMPGMAPRMHGGQHMGMFPHGPQMGYPQRPFAGPAPRMPSPAVQALGRGFQGEAPPGFGQSSMAAGGFNYAAGAPGGQVVPSHSRQASGSMDGSRAEASQPIARPAPIKRPASVKPVEMSGSGNAKQADVDDLSSHLGSSALLADDDEPLPKSPMENRRSSAVPGMGGAVRPPGFASSPFDHGPGGFGIGGRLAAAGDAWRTPSGHFGTPPMAPSGWGSAVQGSSGWGSHGPFNAAMHRSSTSRPVTVRQLACQACRNLSSRRAGADGGFHEIQEVIREMAALRPANEPSPQLAELQDILDTEGDANNGGGFFVVSRDAPSNGSLVKWESDARGAAGLGLGEIGSPIPSNSLPHLGRF